MRISVTRFSAAAICSVALAACSSGGSSGLPSAAQPASKATTASVSFRIAVPTAQTNALRRNPQYVSAATESASIAVAPSGGSAGTPTVVNCTTVCSATIDAPLGSDTFAVNLYSAQNGLGNVLSTGTATQTIAIDQANAVSLTFNGVVASFAISLSANGSPISTLAVGTGTTTTITVGLNALDATGDTIVGTGDYVDGSGNPITISLNNSATSGVGALTQASLTEPATTPITFTYNGTTAIADPVITASTGTLTPARATLVMTQRFGNQTTTVQSFTVPSGVASLKVTAVGAGGGGGSGTSGGSGASLTGTFTQTAGNTLAIIVGGGGSGSGGGAGGGGSFVFDGMGDLMIAAGGGGGGGTGSAGFSADGSSTSGGAGGDGGGIAGANGTGGAGGSTGFGGGGGGGTVSAGTNGSEGFGGGVTSSTSGGSGGVGGVSAGGFGGGGAGAGGGGGGGGGFSGGGGGSGTGGGGGAGSIDNGSNPSTGIGDAGGGSGGAGSAGSVMISW
jgi:hypothetical protein